MATAALGALILGEYEFTVTTGLLAGAALGWIIAEIVASLGGWRGVLPAVVSAAIAAAALAWAGWIDAGWGLERYPNGAWVAVVTSAAVAVGTCTWPAARHLPGRQAGDDSP